MASNLVGQRPHLFSSFAARDCPIYLSPITDPLFTYCNQAKTRLELIDRICSEIFEAQQKTGEYPAWYAENGIRFSEAMDALKIDPEIQNKIGPDAPAYRRLLTPEGIFSSNGLHAYQTESLIDWLYRGQRSYCPECSQPSGAAFSKAYHCFVKYQDPDRYLTDESIQQTFQTEQQRREGVNRSLANNTKIQRFLAAVESGTRNYLLPAAIFTINVRYFLIAYDTFFAANLTSKFSLSYDVQDYIITGLTWMENTQIVWTFLRTGAARRSNDYLSLYENLLATHFFFIPHSIPTRCLQIFAIYYSVQNIGKMILPAQVLHHRYMEQLGNIHTKIFEPMSNLALRIDAFVQRQIGRWLFSFLRYSFRCSLYLVVFCLAAFALKKESALKITAGLNALIVLLINQVHKTIKPYLDTWEATKNICLILQNRAIWPLLVNNYIVYRHMFSDIVWLTGGKYLGRSYACYVVFRDMCWLLKLPNPIRYVPFLRRFENAPILNY
jgi:hypothetical protein